MSDQFTRREMIKSTAAAGVGGVIALAGGSIAMAADEIPMPVVQNKRINQSVCQWCFKDWSKDQLCGNAQKLGLYGIDLVGPDWFDTLKKYNLVGTMTTTHGITKGLNRKENWDECLGKIRTAIDATAAAGYPNVICFSGNRDGMADDVGMKNCAEALKQVVGYAEEKKITINMELLNSKTNHKDYMCDRTVWGVELCKMVGSDRFKLLYDIYHMQIDEGDVIATIRQYKEYIGHYHTAGVPGRNELDDTQELNYGAITNAIVATGFKGVMAQEFIPKRDPFVSLAQAVKVCDV
jgi:hydroxypyruvate isomerase